MEIGGGCRKSAGRGPVDSAGCICTVGTLSIEDVSPPAGALGPVATLGVLIVDIEDRASLDPRGKCVV